MHAHLCKWQERLHVYRIRVGFKARMHFITPQEVSAVQPYNALGGGDGSVLQFALAVPFRE